MQDKASLRTKRLSAQVLEHHFDRWHLWRFNPGLLFGTHCPKHRGYKILLRLVFESSAYYCHRGALTFPIADQHAYYELLHLESLSARSGRPLGLKTLVRQLSTPISRNLTVFNYRGISTSTWLPSNYSPWKQICSL